MDDLREKLLLELSHRSNTCISKTRLLVIDGICNAPDSIHVEDLWMKLRKNYKISRSAVYKTINVLVKKGVLNRQPQSFGYTYSVVSQNLINKECLR